MTYLARCVLRRLPTLLQKLLVRVRLLAFEAVERGVCVFKRGSPHRGFYFLDLFSSLSQAFHGFLRRRRSILQSERDFGEPAELSVVR